MGEGRSERGTVGLTGLHRYTWWAVPGTTAFLLVLLIGDWILDGDWPLWIRIVGAPALVVVTLTSVALLSRRLERPADTAPPEAPAGGLLPTAASAAVVLAVLPLTRHEYGVWAVAPAVVVAITATYLPPRRRRQLITVAVVLAVLPGGALSLAAGDGRLTYATLFPAGLVACTAWLMLGPLWAWDIAGRLDRARRLEADLAVKDERLRFAADLHDIQGHHLQVIALKSELAARLVDIDPARATAEMKGIRQLSADALRDTRAVVQGYRTTTLDDEIANAARVLASADIDAAMNVRSGTVPAEAARHLLGLVMREATTNVLRHSRARHAAIDYRVSGGRAVLRVSNDGADVRPAAADGSGLRTLAERLRTAGGELTWGRDGERFVLTASLPAGPAGTDRPVG